MESLADVPVVDISSKGNCSSVITLNPSNFVTNGWSRYCKGEFFRTYKRRRLELKPQCPQDGTLTMEVPDWSTSQVISYPRDEIPLNNSSSSITVFDNLPARTWKNVIMEQVCEHLSQRESNILNTNTESFISTLNSRHLSDDKGCYHYKAGMRKCTLQKPVQGPQNVTEISDVVVPNVALEHGDHNGNTSLCRRAFMNILSSEEFGLMCNRLHENFSGVEVDKFFDFDSVISRMMHGSYGCSPVLFSYDIEQVWAKVRKVLCEMLSIVNDLSECSKTCCAELFCGSLTDTFPEGGKHEFDGNKWGPRRKAGEYSVAMGSRDRKATVDCENRTHENCVVCARMNPGPTRGPGSPLLGPPGEDGSPARDEDGSPSYECGVCRGRVEDGEEVRVCSHPHCYTKYYHLGCLTGGESRPCGPHWYCPSCLCRGCLVDQDDEVIVLCDGCAHAYHIYCMDPPLGRVPRGVWFCRSCADGLCRLMAARAGHREEEMEKRTARAQRRVGGKKLIREMEEEEIGRSAGGKKPREKMASDGAGEEKRTGKKTGSAGRPERAGRQVGGKKLVLTGLRRRKGEGSRFVL